MGEAKEAVVVQQPVEVQPESTPPRALTVFARNPQEMNVAQGQLIEWSLRKLGDLRAEKDDLDENLSIAAKNGWRTVTLKRQLARVAKRIEFYRKVKAALEAGYCIVPNFPIDIFAVRTTKTSPSGVTQRIDMPPLMSPRLDDQQSNSPPIGEGAYVSERATTYERREPLDPVPGKVQQTRIRVWADAFREVDFPFAFAQPAVFSATQRAMVDRVFDELGVSPARASTRTRGDPMVIGRIYAPHLRWERETKCLSFVVAWFLRERDLDL